jgi:hypothetical protein
MRKTALPAALACFALVLSSAVALAAENWLGTWKLNVAKSKYRPGPAPKSLTLVFESTADGIKLTSDGMDAQGKPTHAEYVSKFDGVDASWTGNPDADTASAKKIDDNSYVNVWKKNGKRTITAKAIVSKDGKTITTSLKGKNAKGQSVNNTLVFDRQ